MVDFGSIFDSDVIEEVVEVTKELGPFDFIKAINYTQENIFKTRPMDAPGAYNPFLVNRSLSYFKETCLLANIMNQHANNLPKDVQFLFFLSTIKPAKRFAPWVKPTKSEDIDAIKQLYHCNNRRAAEALDILTEEQVAAIRERVAKGGSNKKVAKAKG